MFAESKARKDEKPLWVGCNLERVTIFRWELSPVKLAPERLTPQTTFKQVHQLDPYLYLLVSYVAARKSFTRSTRLSSFVCVTMFRSREAAKLNLLAVFKESMMTRDHGIFQYFYGFYDEDLSAGNSLSYSWLFIIHGTWVAYEFFPQKFLFHLWDGKLVVSNKWRHVIWQNVCPIFHFLFAFWWQS